MPALRHPKVSVSPAKTRNGMRLRGGAHAKVAAAIHGSQEEALTLATATTAVSGNGGSKGTCQASEKKKTSSTVKTTSKKANTKYKAEEAAAQMADIAEVAAIEDALARAVKEAASAPPRRPTRGEFYCVCNTRGNDFLNVMRQPTKEPIWKVTQGRRNCRRKKVCHDLRN